MALIILPNEFNSTASNSEQMLAATKAKGE